MDNKTHTLGIISPLIISVKEYLGTIQEDKRDDSNEMDRQPLPLPLPLLAPPGASNGLAKHRAAAGNQPDQYAKNRPAVYGSHPPELDRRKVSLTLVPSKNYPYFSPFPCQRFYNYRSSINPFTTLVQFGRI